MNRLLLFVAAVALAALGGCAVAPVPWSMAAAVEPPVYAPPVYAPPPGVVYVAPTYPMPAPGYSWQFHAQYGWGWHHPVYGWHGGWH